MSKLTKRLKNIFDDYKLNKKRDNIEEKSEIQKRREAYREKYMELTPISEEDYEKWIKKLELKEKFDENFSYTPKISVLISAYDVEKNYLIECLESVLCQIYDNWEVYIVDKEFEKKSIISRYERERKDKIIYFQDSTDICNGIDLAIKKATGDFIAFLDAKDILSSNALYEVVKKLNKNPNLNYIYSDEDCISEDGKRRYKPHFKPDWSPDTLMSFMYTNNLSVCRKSIVGSVGGIRTQIGSAYKYDLILRITEKTNEIGHIDKVIYHCREKDDALSFKSNVDKSYLESIKTVKMEALQRRGQKAELELIDEIGLYRVNYVSKDNPLISIVIPSKDNYIILERCIKTLVSITEYKNYEIILVDNGSNEDNFEKYSKLSKAYNINYIYQEMQFNFSRMCNVGANVANGDYLLFLNDDIEILNENWLSRMIGQAELEHIGAVGAKLLYPGGNKIQHVGVLQLECGPGHAFTGQEDNETYYFARNKIEYNWLAVTAACLLVSKDKFYQVSGFSEELAVTYNDVDLCYKLAEAGFYNVVRNDAILYHHESISRGNDLIDANKMSRLMMEQERLYKKHPKYDKCDPFYNKNLTQQEWNFSFRNNVKPHMLKEVVECNDKFLETDKLRCSVDGIIVVNELYYVDGWAFVEGQEDNNDINLKILLIGDAKSYLVDTDKVYRPDVAECFVNQRYIDFVGYRCKFDIQSIEDGEYRIAIVSGNLYQMVDRVLCKTN